MDDFNFKSQIATDRNQSERLLALGLKPETADMVHCIKTRNHLGDEIERHSYYSFGTEVDERPLGYSNYEHFLAWSLHRLIEMMPKNIAIDGDTAYPLQIQKRSDGKWCVGYQGWYDCETQLPEDV